MSYRLNMKIKILLEMTVSINFIINTKNPSKCMSYKLNMKIKIFLAINIK